MKSKRKKNQIQDSRYLNRDISHAASLFSSNAKIARQICFNLHANNDTKSDKLKLCLRMLTLQGTFSSGICSESHNFYQKNIAQ